MKLSFFFFLFLSFSCFSQSPSSVLKKNKIKKVVINEKTPEGNLTETVKYYDAKGNDTATISYGERYEHIDYEYNSANKILKKHVLWASGEPKEEQVYFYQKDGTCKTENKDVQFGLVQTAWYDRRGYLIKAKIPDGSVFTFTNDKKGNVIKTTKSSPGEKVQTQTYTYRYDGNGNVLEKKGSDGSLVKNKYNEKGLLTESVLSVKSGRQIETYSYTYVYE